MTAAVMLPTALPLFRRFERLVHSRPDRRRLIAGYLVAWAGFGIAAHVLDAAVHDVARQSD